MSFETMLASSELHIAVAMDEELMTTFSRRKFAIISAATVHAGRKVSRWTTSPACTDDFKISCRYACLSSELHFLKLSISEESAVIS